MLTVVTNRLLCRDAFLERIRRIASARPDRILLREKDLTEQEYLLLAEECKRICDHFQVELMLHSHLRIAREIGTASIHLPYHSFLESINEISAFDTVSVSVHSVEEAGSVERLGGNSIITGHIFPTACKKNIPPRGVDYLQSVCAAVKIPVHGIGGINLQNYGAVRKAGAAGICVMSELMVCAEPERLMASYKRRIRGLASRR